MQSLLASFFCVCTPAVYAGVGDYKKVFFLKAFCVVEEGRQTHLRLTVFTSINNCINYKGGKGEGGRRELLQIKIDLRCSRLNAMCGPFLGLDLNQHVKRHGIIGNF